MTSGAAMWSRGSSAVFSSVSGAWSADYPASHLSNLLDISKVARVVPAAGVAALKFVMPASADVQFVGLVRHNIPTGAATMRIRLFSNNNPDPVASAAYIVADSGVIPVWPAGAPIAGYPAPVRPHVFGAKVTAWSGRIDFTGLPAAVEIGGIDVGEWWTWDFSPGREIGFDPRAPKVELAGGGLDVGTVWSPRIIRGQIDLLALKESATKGIDFQAFLGTSRPFTFVENYEDATTWSRKAMLVLNQELPPSTGALYRSDTFQFRLREHWR